MEPPPLPPKVRRWPLPVRIVFWSAIVFAGFIFMGFLLSECEKSATPSGTARGTPHVRVGANDVVLRVTNESTQDWNEMVIYLNGRPPFTYKWEGRAPAIGESTTIPLREFAKDNGERFDGYRMKVLEVWIGGGGYDYQGVHF
jgi:hypothetical protein